MTDRSQDEVYRATKAQADRERDEVYRATKAQADRERARRDGQR